MPKVIFCLLLFGLTLPPDFLKAQDHGAIRKLVSNCVKFVREFKDDDPTYSNFYRRFDAFYNQALGIIENNAYAVGDQRARFQFNKCMAHNGVPLGQKTQPNEAN